MSRRRSNLINLGNLSSLEGDYPRAAARYREALALYRAHGNRVDAASSAARARPARIAARRLSTGRSTDSRKRSPCSRRRGRRRTRSTCAATSRPRTPRWGTCRVRSSSSGTPSASRHARTLGAARDRRLLALARADLAVEFNTFPEAERQYARAEQAVPNAGEARAARQRRRAGSASCSRCARTCRARSRASRSRCATQEALGDPRAIALTRILVGSIQSQMRRQRRRRAPRSRGDRPRCIRLGDAAGEASALGMLGRSPHRRSAPRGRIVVPPRALAPRLDARPFDLAGSSTPGLGDALRSRDARQAARRVSRRGEGHRTDVGVRAARAAPRRLRVGQVARCMRSSRAWNLARRTPTPHSPQANACARASCSTSSRAGACDASDVRT